MSWDPWFVHPAERHRQTSVVVARGRPAHLPDVPELIRAVIRAELTARQAMHTPARQQEEVIRMFDWSEYAPHSAAMVRWEEPGQQVVGVVQAIRTHVFTPERGPVPLLDIETDDGELVTVAVDKLDLRRQVVDAAPQVGDRIRIRFRDTERRPAGVAKLFDVQVRRAPSPDEPF